MAKNTLNIDDEVLDILKQSEIGDNYLKLPDQLSRPMYVKTMKVIELAGGKWSKKDKKHVFASDPREKLGLAIEKGEILDEKKELQQFYTPADIVHELVKIADVKYKDLVLEPSAGRGAIALEARKAGATVICKEISPENCKHLHSLGFGVDEGDFLKANVEPIFDKILMNPPFTAGQDCAHIEHAFKFLKSGGVLVAITSPSWQFREQSKYKHFKNLVEENGEVVKELPEGTFRESGTNIRTVIIKLVKP